MNGASGSFRKELKVHNSGSFVRIVGNSKNHFFEYQQDEITSGSDNDYRKNNNNGPRECFECVLSSFLQFGIPLW